MAQCDVSTQGSPKRKRKLKAIDSNAADFIDLPEAAASKPVGFAKESDFQEWPLHVVNSLCKFGNQSDSDQELSLRLQQHFLRGIVLNTDYSGIDCPREALELAAKSFNILHGVGCVDDAGASAVTVGRTCDKGAIQKRIQVAMSETFESGQRCHFEDLRFAGSFASRGPGLGPSSLAREDRLQGCSCTSFQFHFCMVDGQPCLALQLRCNCLVLCTPEDCIFKVGKTQRLEFATNSFAAFNEICDTVWFFLSLFEQIFSGYE